MSFITEPAGANPALTHTVPQFKPGTIGRGNNGTEWMYVKASGAAIKQYYVAAINNSFGAAPASATTAAQGYKPGIAQAAFAQDEYGWVAVRGGGDLKVKTAATCVKDSQLFVGTTGNSAGVVGSSSATGSCKLNGVVTVTTAASAGALPTVTMTSPWFTP